MYVSSPQGGYRGRIFVASCKQCIRKPFDCSWWIRSVDVHGHWNVGACSALPRAIHAALENIFLPVVFEGSVMCMRILTHQAKIVLHSNEQWMQRRGQFLSDIAR